MSGLVAQLQEDALNSSIPVSALLRKVKVAAVKLGLNDALDWVSSELDGYDGEVPAYRQVLGDTQAMDDYGRWLPVHISDAESSVLISTVWLHEPIGTFEALLEQPGSGNISKAMQPGLVELLNDSFQWSVHQARNIIPRGSIVGITERVRNAVLDWAIELERAGITGSGLSFSSMEREKAASSAVHIGVFHGSFNTGDASGQNARITQGGTDQSTNIAGDGSIFSEIDSAVRTAVPAGAARDAILEAARQMRDAEPSDRLSTYQSLIAAAANHMTVLGPFSPCSDGYARSTKLSN